MEHHLTSELIEEILRPAERYEETQAVNRNDREVAYAHLKVCESCQSMLRGHQEAMDRLLELRSDSGAPRGPHCPPESVWIELAAGLPMEQRGDYLMHSGQCDHCGPLLREAMADCGTSADHERNDEIELLGSASPKWQRSMARELRSATFPDAKADGEEKRRMLWKGIFGVKGLAFVGCAGLAVFAGYWQVWHRFRATEPVN